MALMMRYSLLLVICYLFVITQTTKLDDIISKYKHHPLNNQPKHTRTTEPGVDPECHMNFCEISRFHGYHCEEYLHQVVTEDGFLLTLHRVNGKAGQSHNPSGSRPPIFVQHGLLCDSTSWVLNLPEQSLVFMLSDAGFDVWVGNSRGNTYSRAHRTLKPDTDEFWAWSWDEMALYDLPASIDFVLNHTTGFSSVQYVGHSQGTLIAFVYLSQNPTYQKISHVVAMGPVFELGHMSSPIKYFAGISSQIALVFKIFGIRDFLPNSWLMEWLADNFCNEYNPLHSICGDFLFTIAGSDVKQLNQTRMPVYISHTPAGASVRDIMHFSQMYNSKHTTRFDYGSDKENMKRYNSTYPPVYSISPITTPVSLFHAENDLLADPQDVKYITSNLKTIQNNAFLPKWNHLDFIWAVDANTLVYNDIIKILRGGKLRT